MHTEDDSVKNITQDVKDFPSDTLPEVKQRVDGNAPPPKASGGQPGNQNARKHGRYAKILTPNQEDAFSDPARERNLDREIAVMRVRIRSLLDYPAPNMNLVLRAFGTLARMIRRQNQIRYGG